jgi:NAD(P)H-flavin reductase
MAKIALEDSKITNEFEILSKELVTHDTLRLKFALPSDDHLLGFSSGQHVLFIVNIGNKEISRKYTPISLENEKGTFEFVIKVRVENKYSPILRLLHEFSFNL